MVPRRILRLTFFTALKPRNSLVSPCVWSTYSSAIKRSLNPPWPQRISLLPQRKFVPPGRRHRPLMGPAHTCQHADDRSSGQELTSRSCLCPTFLPARVELDADHGPCLGTRASAAVTHTCAASPSNFVSPRLRRARVCGVIENENNQNSLAVPEAAWGSGGNACFSARRKAVRPRQRGHPALPLTLLWPCR